MLDQSIQNQTAVQKMAGSMRTVFFLSLATNAFDVYRFASAPGELRQGINAALGILGTIMVWQLSRSLRAGKKQSLFYWLAMVVLGYTRFIFVDAAFELNILTVLLICSAIVLTLKIFLWTRNGALT